MLDLLMLILATMGAMAFGILTAYAILRAGFALMRRTPRRPALLKTRSEIVQIS